MLSSNGFTIISGSEGGPIDGLMNVNSLGLAWNLWDLKNTLFPAVEPPLLELFTLEVLQS